MPAPSYKGRRRQHPLWVMLNAEENRQLNRVLRSTGLSKSDFVRDVIKQHHKKLVDSRSAAH